MLQGALSSDLARNRIMGQRSQKPGIDNYELHFPYSFSINLDVIPSGIYNQAQNLRKPLLKISLVYLETFSAQIIPVSMSLTF